ncbi:hypothetical protein KFL_006120010 [Klebsormidium nitens]|uniref:Uncharacterized protein n=1 Tax=Klebsormidium nitens TaxID=105231 RepID=A0A1Y1INJ2_KLENI|nr:hypothetical protein KFL_006120010 [Klebsormidium nitens]|eukprot:GAQ90197.1 hypothetical protein KFL_006120010 [Klebsormidium nitens]
MTYPSLASGVFGQVCKGLSAKPSFALFALCAAVSCLALAPVIATSCGDDTDCTNGATCCNASSGGTGDPHFFLTVPQTGQQMTWDFHGMGNQSYCMISDHSICLNAHMFNLPPDINILHRAASAVDSFFEGTWMDAIGIVYSTPENNDQQALEIVHNQTRARAASDSEEPLAIHFLEKDTGILVPDGASTWTSPDETLTITYKSENRTFVTISIPNQLKMDIWVEVDKEIISDPPIYGLSFDIQSISITPEVHGFVGQMYAPGAIEERLRMGTLEGLLHREYVEGMDDDYATSNLTATDCFFSRFKTAEADVTTRTSIDVTSTPPRLSLTGRRLLVATPPQCQCQCGGGPCTGGQLCCNNACADVMSDYLNCGSCGQTCFGGSCCGGESKDLTSNTDACGSCSNKCASGELCCGAQCANLTTSTSNCGGCGRACGSSESCCGGSCCAAGNSCCGETCTNLKSDTRNCGICNKACASGETCCGGVCADKGSDTDNCGACGHKCGPNESCCSGTCANLATSTIYCGSCNHAPCGPGEECCAGVCANTDSNSNNCGDCGHSCPFTNPYCINGACYSSNDGGGGGGNVPGKRLRRRV